ncbi:cytochrome C oxidase assembly protein [Novosphingobium nitrogenifigens DSM 19370]|uniref:Cytochrome c oxidase assembly protein CtaG n=1 Tax=Novosphingobium nitrogenifigens DSM 19370 TaxID=983920 RepID=F1Z6V3_9SPHN|nr:cytochrome c oxidase assembly protein [Novosphingobium nitrogenifigens]EGD59763.1 cytochrome C oxidase assembly protein [Novosphingobium nitrogenifigens DSM 19370]
MASAPPSHAARNRRVATLAALGGLAMLGLGYASVPLYRLFCQATGFNGTTQRATAAQADRVHAVAQPITIRFDANVAPGLKWIFRPEQVSQDGRIGERKIAYFYARNLTDHAITGRAVFNVTPEQTGAYFHKIQCFCFSEQRLEAGQEVRMPVIYYVDPAMLQDADARSTPVITLSYTFMEAAGSRK